MTCIYADEHGCCEAPVAGKRTAYCAEHTGVRSAEWHDRAGLGHLLARVGRAEHRAWLLAVRASYTPRWREKRNRWKRLEAWYMLLADANANVLTYERAIPPALAPTFPQGRN